MVWGYDTSQEHIPEWFCENGLATPELRQKCLDHNMKATVTYTSRPGWTNDHGQPCREYTTRPQGSVVLEYGVACRGTDGLWRIVPCPGSEGRYGNRRAKSGTNYGTNEPNATKIRGHNTFRSVCRLPGRSPGSDCVTPHASPPARPGRCRMTPLPGLPSRPVWIA